MAPTGGAVTRMEKPIRAAGSRARVLAMAGHQYESRHGQGQACSFSSRKGIAGGGQVLNQPARGTDERGTLRGEASVEAQTIGSFLGSIHGHDDEEVRPRAGVEAVDRSARPKATDSPRPAIG